MTNTPATDGSDSSDRSASPQTPDFTLTQSAAAQIAKITGAPGKRYLRVGVKGGGCSGFSYIFDFADAVADDDVLVERDGAGVVIDEASLPFMAGSQLDFVDDLIGAAFQVRNPNATANCGCGVSFSI